MRDKILIGVIILLAMTAIGIGIYVAIVPTVKPPEPKVLTHEEIYPTNETPGLIGIKKPEKKVERLFAIRNYTEEINSEEINKISKLRYYILDPEAKGHLLVLPFRTGGKLTIKKSKFDDFLEEIVAGDTILEENITPGYALLIKYDRIEEPEIEITITEGEKTASVWITNAGEGASKIQYVKLNEDSKVEIDSTSKLSTADLEDEETYNESEAEFDSDKENEDGGAIYKESSEDDDIGA